ncbi:uncharacterized protein RSE6_08837 [Rhynchosporium secalis]|uniref:JmjC domain-containing protein n=1 Tax=Rhynchosporium secalis TaxID=38038 RepID=A0A1E1MGH0_RHYSE|nr:uncharacterized protein RSE6_08837 [Rhynchosporium secalis]
MLRVRIALTRSIHSSRRFYGSPNALPAVPTIAGPLDLIDVAEFRTKAFTPENPLLITAGERRSAGEADLSACSIPAADKWFVSRASSSTGAGGEQGREVLLSQEYLAPFADTILPYELITPSAKDVGVGDNKQLSNILKHYIQDSEGTTFHRFSAPLSLLQLCSQAPSPRPALYIAQAQLIDLPLALRADVPTPHLVLQAGKGDVYDANLWMGIPPTYTPLHKDPNPNLFLQLASQKRVRLFEPSNGAGIFRHVQKSIGRAGHGGAIRGNEMMEGLERRGLHDAVWGKGMDNDTSGGYETIVGPGDALFIPKGWWHSFISVGNGMNGSANWWFR